MLKGWDYDGPVTTFGLYYVSELHNKHTLLPLTQWGKWDTVNVEAVVKLAAHCCRTDCHKITGTSKKTKKKTVGPQWPTQAQVQTQSSLLMWIFCCWLTACGIVENTWHRCGHCKSSRQEANLPFEAPPPLKKKKKTVQNTAYLHPVEYNIAF